eukprot:m.27087 g.27087  ORF g.27087 m.27087 type:complete len:535 (-) comp7860_c0_seq1:1170-2774(-)
MADQTKEEVHVDKTKKVLDSSCSFFTKAKSDEERFAALMMVVNSMPSGDEAAVKQVFDSVGVKFIKRLINSPVPKECPQDIYKDISCNVLSVFASVPSIATNELMVEMIEPLLSCLENVGEAESSVEEKPHYTSALETILAISTCPEGRNVLIRIGGDQVLLSFLSASTNAANAAARCLTNMAVSIESRGVGCAKLSQKRFLTILKAVSKCFSSRQDAVKFVVCEQLIGLLDYVLGVSTESDTNSDSAKTNLKKVLVDTSDLWVKSSDGVAWGLYDMLSSRLTEELRGAALRLGALVCEACGETWLLVKPSRKESPKKESKDENEEKGPLPKTKPNRSVLALVIHLCSVELRMALEDRSATKAVAQHELVVSCLALVERAIIVLSGVESMADLGDAESVIHMCERLNDSASAIMSILREIWSDLKDMEDMEDNKEKRDDFGILISLLYPSCRVFALWLAQETDALRDDVFEILPFILQVSGLSKSSEPWQKSLQFPALVDFLVPALSYLLEDQRAMAILHKENCDVENIKILCS